MSQYLPRYSNVNNIDNDLTRQGWNMRSRGNSETIDILERDNLYKKTPQYIPRDLYNTGNPNPNNPNNPILKKPSFDDLLSQYSSDSSSTTSNKSIESYTTPNQNLSGINHANLNNSDINIRNSELKQFDQVNRLNIEIDGYKKEIVAYKSKMKLIRDKDIELQKAKMEVEKSKRLFASIPELNMKIKTLQQNLIDSELKLTTHKNKELELSILNDAVSNHEKSLKNIKSQYDANYNALNSKCNYYMKITNELNTKLENLKNNYSKLNSENAIINSRLIEMTGKNSELNKQIPRTYNISNKSDNITDRLKNIDIEYVPISYHIPPEQSTKTIHPIHPIHPIDEHLESIRTIIKSRLNIDVSETYIKRIINEKKYALSKDTIRQNIHDLIVFINNEYNPILNIEDMIDDEPIKHKKHKITDTSHDDTEISTETETETDTNTNSIIISSTDRDKNKYRSPFNFVYNFNKSVSYIAIKDIKIPTHLEEETLYLNIPEMGAKKILLNSDKEIQYENKSDRNLTKLSIGFTLDDKLIMEKEGDEIQFTIHFNI